MYDIDDPTLALILRFVGRVPEIAFRDDEFLKRQRREIREHVRGFPAEERRARACEWIEAHAEEYRNRWTLEILDGVLAGQRCPDCPLVAAGSTDNCRIHDEWLDLLHRYVADEISARVYVESSLELLAEHKEQLEVKLVPVRARA